MPISIVTKFGVDRIRIFVRICVKNTYRLSLKPVTFSIAEILLINYLTCLTLIMDNTKVKSNHGNQKNLLLVIFRLSLKFVPLSIAEILLVQKL